MLLALLAGCQDYRWIPDDFRMAQQKAEEQNKDLFIFYKWWLSNESNRMHGEVLESHEVGSLLKDTVNLLLERDSTVGAAQYMSKYGITSAPAFVIVKPDGTYMARTGFIPKEQFIDFLKSARSSIPGAEKSTKKQVASQTNETQ